MGKHFLFNAKRLKHDICTNIVLLLLLLLLLWFFFFSFYCFFTVIFSGSSCRVFFSSIVFCFVGFFILFISFLFYVIFYVCFLFTLSFYILSLFFSFVKMVFSHAKKRTTTTGTMMTVTATSSSKTSTSGDASKRCWWTVPNSCSRRHGFLCFIEIEKKKNERKEQITLAQFFETVPTTSNSNTVPII